MSLRGFVLASVLGACSGDPEAPRLLDTGWFTTDDAPGCPHVVVSTEPDAGESAWFYRDAPRILTSTTDPSGYEAVLAEAEGRLVETEVVWSELDSTLSLVPAEPLRPATDFELVVQDCERTSSIEFTTSSFGLPLVDGGDDLPGRTYRLDLAGARWQKPQGLGSTLASFLTEPILIGVVYVDAERIDLLGAPSSVSDLGVVSQASAPTWDFPVAAFALTDPRFTVAVDAIELLVDVEGDTTALPVTEFAFTGTLSPDGDRIGGGALSGIADTRSLASAALGSENAICEIAETSFQISCFDCASDGEPFCLELEAEGVSGVEQPGLTLVTR